MLSHRIHSHSHINVQAFYIFNGNQKNLNQKKSTLLSKLGTCFNAIEENAQDTIDLPKSRETVDKTEKVVLTSIYLPYVPSESQKVYLNLGYHYFPKKCWNLFNRNKIINSYEENRTKKT